MVTLPTPLATILGTVTAAPCIGYMYGQSSVWTK